MLQCETILHQVHIPRAAYNAIQKSLSASCTCLAAIVIAAPMVHYTRAILGYYNPMYPLLMPTLISENMVIILVSTHDPVQLIKQLTIEHNIWIFHILCKRYDLYQ